MRKNSFLGMWGPSALLVGAMGAACSQDVTPASTDTNGVTSNTSRQQSPGPSPSVTSSYRPNLQSPSPDMASPSPDMASPSPDMASPSPDMASPSSEDGLGPHRIYLRWLKNDSTQSFEQAIRGMNWALSTLGAIPPADNAAYEQSQLFEGGVHFILNLEKAGLEARALPLLEPILRELKQEDSYRLFGAIDVGHFLMETLFDPATYYALTGACSSLPAWIEAFEGPDIAQFAVTESFLVNGDRLLTFNNGPQSIGDIAHRATEGEGQLAEGTFVPLEFETVHVMSNGRQRFAVYALNGQLRPGGDPLKSPAGLPGKCMWCHEDHLQRGNSANETVDGYLSHEAFLQAIDEQDALMFGVREAHSTAVDHSNRQEHAYMEWLEEFYLHPSALRVASEWQVDVAKVQEIAVEESWTAEKHPEYASLGPLFIRSQVDLSFEGHVQDFLKDENWFFYGQFAGSFQAPKVAESAREWDGEVDESLWSQSLEALAPCSPLN